MMDDLRDLMRDAVRADAAAGTGGDLAGAWGETVRGRVKRRRAARAVGVGSVAAVSVGAVAFGAVRLPGVVNGDFASGPCPPGQVLASHSASPDAATPSAEPSPSGVPSDVSVEAQGGGRYLVTALNGTTELLEVEDGDVYVVTPNGRDGLRERDGVFVLPFEDGTEVQVSFGGQGEEIMVVQDVAEGSFAAEVVTAGTPESEPSVECVTPTPTPSASTSGGVPANICADGSMWMIPAPSRPDLHFGVLDTADPETQDSGVPGVALQPVMIDQRTTTVVIDATTGAMLAMIEEPVDDAEVSDPALRVRIAEDEALLVASAGDEQFTFELADGRWMTATTDTDVYSGVDVVALSAQPPQEVSPSGAPDDGTDWATAASELADSFELEWAAEWECVSTSAEADVPAAENSPEPSATSSPDASPALTQDPEGEAGVLGATSPYQCGYVLGTERRATPEWSIVNPRWIDPESAWSTFEEWYIDPPETFLVEPSGPVAVFEADGAFFDSRGLDPAGGGLGTDVDGVFGDVFHYEGLGSRSLSFAAVLDGVVVATANHAAMPSGVLVDKHLEHALTAAFLLSSTALEPCSGHDREDVERASVVAISAVAARDDSGDLEVQYAWEPMPSQ